MVVFFVKGGKARARASQTGTRRSRSREVGVFEGRKGCARLHNTTLNMKLAKIRRKSHNEDLKRFLLC
ncbi:hypothetical protein QQF64_001895 [Cirrhinus molitorella]|uniref:Uncharacterized protein n=2 Tax=Cirrhinus molitorella TaxID=172907 RepID=A0AA88P5N6_9TELE|nr:hypothetical protein Q8A67_023352 [Cirrhinus molitorella]